MWQTWSDPPQTSTSNNSWEKNPQRGKSASILWQAYDDIMLYVYVQLKREQAIEPMNIWAVPRDQARAYFILLEP